MFSRGGEERREIHGEDNGYRMKTRIVIAADRSIVLEGMVALLNNTPDIDVVGHAADGLELSLIHI